MIYNNQVAIALLEGKQEYQVPEDYPIKGEIYRIKLNGDSIYGRLEGIQQALREVKEEYICLNAMNLFPDVSEGQLDDLVLGKTGMILSRVYCAGSMQESYRAVHYDYDFRMMISVLKKFYPDYHRHAKKVVLNKTELIQMGGVFRKEELQRACKWVFSAAKKCAQFIPRHFSIYQSHFPEHLSPYLFTIYVTYWQKTHSYELTGITRLLEKDNSGKKQVSRQKREYGEILSDLSGYMSKRNVEDAVKLALTLPDEPEELKRVKSLFIQYEKERRYYRDTLFDKGVNWHQILRKPPKPPASRAGKKRIRLLIFKWSSVGHEVNVKAFESFGFECHTIRVPYERGIFDEECLEQLNCHLDANQFDLVFSLNCIGMVAEACYIHDIPYIAWCYDSPSFTGAHWYLKYSTTYVFLFDSDDAEHYQKAGIRQAYYMPLAVNLEYFEGVSYEEKERNKFETEISFVGSLYDTSLPEAMGYLSDYQKGYLNALIDNQMDVYGHSFFPEILSQKFMEWLDEPEFNRLLNAEFDKEKAKEDTAAAGRLQLILNKQTTNKERLLLLNLLGKHHQVKLYSYKNAEALQGITFCGTADYYREMPKIFRYSKINLNATLRSIQNGIPLRCLDVMGCHGLLLTNYQKDFDDHFKDGENVLFYTDAEEALEKADFYLAHDTLCRKIAEAGFETVRKYYDYPVKIREIFEIAGLTHLMPVK